MQNIFYKLLRKSVCQILLGPLWTGRFTKLLDFLKVYTINQIISPSSETYLKILKTPETVCGGLAWVREKRGRVRREM